MKIFSKRTLGWPLTLASWDEAWSLPADGQKHAPLIGPLGGPPGWGGPGDLPCFLQIPASAGVLLTQHCRDRTSQHLWHQGGNGALDHLKKAVDYLLPRITIERPPSRIHCSLHPLSAALWPHSPVAKCHYWSLSLPNLLCCWESWSPREAEGQGWIEGRMRQVEAPGPRQGPILNGWLQALCPVHLCRVDGESPSVPSASLPCFSDTESEHEAAAVTCQLHWDSMSLPVVASWVHGPVRNWHLCVCVQE